MAAPARAIASAVGEWWRRAGRLVADYVIYPRLIRRGIPLHPLMVILAVLCGAELDGIAGMFLAVPVVGILSWSIATPSNGAGDTQETAADLAVTSPGG